MPLIGLGHVFVLALAALTGCDPAPEVIVDGSSTVFPISRVAQERFYHEVDSSVCVIVDNHGTGGGFGRYLRGEADIVDASRQAKPAEEAEARRVGRPWTRFVVAYDGISVVVHPNNTWVHELSVAQLRALWREDGDVVTWRDLDPDWPNRKITLFSPDDDSGTFDFFGEVILGEDLRQRTDKVQMNSDDNFLIRGVAQTVDGLGYFGFAYYRANTRVLRAVAIRDKGAEQAYLPRVETIGQGLYRPLSRPLFLYAGNRELRQERQIRRFLNFYLNNLVDVVDDEGIVLRTGLASAGGYVAPSLADVRANQARLASLLEGDSASSAEVDARSDPGAETDDGNARRSLGDPRIDAASLDFSTRPELKTNASRSSRTPTPEAAETRR